MTPPAKKATKAAVARRRNARERRDRILSEGGRRVELLLLPEAAEALTDLEAAKGETVTAIVSRLLLRAAKRAR